MVTIKLPKISEALLGGLLLVFPLAKPAEAESDSHRWSADLSRHGFQDGVRGATARFYPEIKVAATKHVVAVAFGHPADKVPITTKGYPYHVPWDVYVLLFDARSGKFLSKSGPWTADSALELYSNIQGNLVLLLRHFHVEGKKPGETLYLLSPSCEEKQRLEIAPSIRNGGPTWNSILRSSSGRYLLVGQLSE